MSAVVEIHRALSNLVVLYFLFVGLWGTYRAIRGQGIDGSFLGAAVIAQLLFVVQAIIGFVLWFGGLNAALSRAGIHLLYGIFALVFMPFVYLTLLRGDDSNRAQWVMAFTLLFLFGIALRAIGTGVVG